MAQQTSRPGQMIFGARLSLLKTFNDGIGALASHASRSAHSAKKHRVVVCGPALSSRGGCDNTSENGLAAAGSKDLRPLGEDGPVLDVEIHDVTDGAGELPTAFDDADGLVFLVSVSDKRVYSMLWELYSIVRRLKTTASICVVLMYKDASDSLPLLSTLASPMHLPPGGTPSWSEKRRWAEMITTEQRSSFVDSEFPASWDDDFRAVLSRGGPRSGRTRVTSTNGIRVELEMTESPPLASSHRGPWTVLPVIETESTLTDANGSNQTCVPQLALLWLAENLRFIARNGAWVEET